MKATVLDLVTGERRVVDGSRSWEWAENNWSCDCNRRTPFLGAELRATSGPTCLGATRFVVVAAEFDAGDEGRTYTLPELNQDYPPPHGPQSL